MRVCYKCKEKKELTEFHNDKTQVGGKSYDCKKCKSERCKQKRKENPEKYKEAGRQAVLRNYEKIRKSQKKYRLENREVILKRRKELRQPRKVEINERESLRRKEQRKKDPEFVERERKRQRDRYIIKKHEMLPKHNAHKLVMYAVKLGLLTKPENCVKCGLKIRIEGHHEDYSKPLEVQWLCKVCHVARHKELNGK